VVAAAAASRVIAARDEVAAGPHVRLEIRTRRRRVRKRPPRARATAVAIVQPEQIPKQKAVAPVEAAEAVGAGVGAAVGRDKSPVLNSRIRMRPTISAGNQLRTRPQRPGISAGNQLRTRPQQPMIGAENQPRERPK
jgi:hypothetical protein